VASKKLTTFAPANFSNQVFSDEARKKFDNWPGWQRHFVKKMLDHGDMTLAAQEAQISRKFKEDVNLKLTEYKSIKEQLQKGGIDASTVVEHIKECLIAEEYKVDAKGHPIRVSNLPLKLRTIEFIAKLCGWMDENKAPQKPKPKSIESGVEELFEED